MITKDILITSEDLMKWLNREITEDDEELCMYLSNAVKNQYEYHKEISRLNNLINKTLTYYYKTLNEYNNQNKKMPDEAVEMFNLLENNK